jgi:pyrroloquinoline quinone (PQQ) biosynthesis protein C
MEQHPWFDGILKHRWDRQQIILGELQHYLRIRTNPIFFGYIAINAVSVKEYAVMDSVLENFMEELGGPRSHMDIMLQFLEEGGITREQADRAEAAPGTLAAIEMIIGCCQRRSALEGIAMLAFVESQLGGAGKISEKVYRELTGYYGFSPRAAETYKIHAAQDEGHGRRQIEAIRLLAADDETQEKVRAAVKLGLTAAGVGRPRSGDDGQTGVLGRCIQSQPAPTGCAPARFERIREPEARGAGRSRLFFPF